MQIYEFLKQFFRGDGKGGGFKLTNNYLDAGLSPFLSFRFKFLAVNLGLGYSRDSKLYSRLTAVLNIIHLYPPVSRYIPQLVVYMYPPVSRYTLVSSILVSSCIQVYLSQQYTCILLYTDLYLSQQYTCIILYPGTYLSQQYTCILLYPGIYLSQQYTCILLYPGIPQLVVYLYAPVSRYTLVSSIFVSSCIQVYLSSILVSSCIQVYLS